MEQAAKEAIAQQSVLKGDNGNASKPAAENGGNGAEQPPQAAQDIGTRSLSLQESVCLFSVSFCLPNEPFLMFSHCRRPPSHVA